MTYIKFWNEDTKEMTKSFNLEMYFNPDQLGYRETVDKEVIPTNKSKILFSTVFLDSKGNEIFDGDLLNTPIMGIVQVVYGGTRRDLGWKETRKERATYKEADFEFYSRCGEIIGNIYENPELLK